METNFRALTHISFSFCFSWFLSITGLFILLAHIKKPHSDCEYSWVQCPVYASVAPRKKFSNTFSVMHDLFLNALHGDMEMRIRMKLSRAVRTHFAELYLNKQTNKTALILKQSVERISFRSGEIMLYLYYPCSDRSVIRILSLVPDIKNESKIFKGKELWKKTKSPENRACNSRLILIWSLHSGKNKR